MLGITLEDFRQSRAYKQIFGLGEAKVTLRLLARRSRLTEQQLLDYPLSLRLDQ